MPAQRPVAGRPVPLRNRRTPAPRAGAGCPRRGFQNCPKKPVAAMDSLVTVTPGSGEAAAEPAGRDNRAVLGHHDLEALGHAGTPVIQRSALPASVAGNGLQRVDQPHRVNSPVTAAHGRGISQVPPSRPLDRNTACDVHITPCASAERSPTVTMRPGSRPLTTMCTGWSKSDDAGVTETLPSRGELQPSSVVTAITTKHTPPRPSLRRQPRAVRSRNKHHTG